MTNALRAIPSVDAVLGTEAVAALAAAAPRALVVDAVREALDLVRRRLAATAGGPAPSFDEVVAEVARHVAAVTRPASEGDAAGSIARVLRCLTGADDAVVAGSGLEALGLALAARAGGRAVVLASAEAVEDEDGGRVLDAAAAAGVRVIEVGCANRTHAEDLESAAGDRDCAAILTVRNAPFTVLGFTLVPAVAALAAAARRLKLPLLVHDMAGDLAGAVAAHLRDGADLVTLPTDRRLGGPRAGLALGRPEALAPLRRGDLPSRWPTPVAVLPALDEALRTALREV